MALKIDEKKFARKIKKINSDIESSNKYNFEFENEYKRIHKAVIEKIVYGSEVAAELEKFLI